MIVRDVGVLGTGLWESVPIGNERFAHLARGAEVKDPFRGARGDDGVVRIAGMEFSPDRDPKTIAAIERAFADPYRGARRRRYFPHDMRTSDAEADAARAALRDAGLEPDQIGAVIVQSFLPDELSPKNSALVAHKLGITRALSCEVDSICNSVITQMLVASSLVASGAAKHVLCVQSCAYSRVTDPGASSTVQEGDGAGAFVIGPSPGTTMCFSTRTDGRLHAAIGLEWRAPSGSEGRRYWERAQEQLLIRFDPALQAQVMGELRSYAKTVCSEALERAELRVEDLDLFVSHQPMSWYTAFIEESLGLREGVAFDTFEEYGSVNSVSISASLHHARRAGRVGAGRRVLMFGPAAGYTYAAVAIRWGER